MANKNNTISSSNTKREKDEQVSRFDDSEKVVMDETNPTDVAIANTLKNYAESMARNVAVDNIADKQIGFWRVVQMVFNSEVGDFNRRMNMLLHYAAVMTQENGALTGELPMRGVTGLPRNISLEHFTHLMSFLGYIGPKRHRVAVLRNTNMEKVSQVVPKAKRQAFLQYFQLMK